MEIGTLNQRITFLVNRVVTDEIGNHTAVWDEAFSCWAKVTLKASSEHTDAGVTKETQTLEFLIRQNQHYFGISFKKMTGKTPTEYAREKRSV